MIRKIFYDKMDKIIVNWNQFTQHKMHSFANKNMFAPSFTQMFFPLFQNQCRQVRRRCGGWGREAPWQVWAAAAAVAARRGQAAPRPPASNCPSWKCVNSANRTRRKSLHSAFGTRNLETSSRPSFASTSRCRGAPTSRSTAAGMWRPASRSTTLSSSSREAEWTGWSEVWPTMWKRRRSPSPP